MRSRSKDIPRKVRVLFFECRKAHEFTPAFTIFFLRQQRSMGCIPIPVIPTRLYS